MRRIFTPLPYFLPAEPEPFVKLFREHGVPRLVKKGEFLKRGGEEQKLFFLEEGLCAYYAAEALDHRPMVISVILPGRVMGDMTASIRTRCNVFTRALKNSRVLTIPPEVLAHAIEVDSDLAAIEIRSIIAKEESLLEGVAANSLRPPAERLVIYAKALCRSFGVRADADGWNRLPLKLPAKTIGEVVNLNRVSVTRLLIHWMEVDAIRKDGRTLYFHQRLFDAVDDWLENRSPVVTLP
ncbi:Crp/Fnr family transcriptional regulator [Sutterella sp.]|uniref:Crp/Fnr family transcriptional regulator n=1 Tax=Sutterella sp. TaxID=1981025 RepID=UPI0026E01EB4|nr:Crp/Fnr family transcriptional regulator [Sutterella sp.]MDO5531961.1 Crp/Fnr family transcriptional regulator [Sutterella sp.]